MITLKLPSSVDFPIPQLRGKMGGLKFPAYGEIKYDGEFTFILYADNKICTVNKYDKFRTNFPALEYIRLAIQKHCKSAVFLAELYYEDGKRNKLYGLNSNKESDDLNLAVFDILEHDGVKLSSQPLIDRKEMLQDMKIGSCLKSKVLKTKADAEAYFKWTVDEGYEGAVIKSMDSHLVSGPCSWVKLKMKDQCDYKVCLIDSSKERIEVLVPKPPAVNGHVKVGVKAAHRYKRYLSVGDLVTIEHQGVLDSGSLRHPVLIPKKEWK